MCGLAALKISNQTEPKTNRSRELCIVEVARSVDAIKELEKGKYQMYFGGWGGSPSRGGRVSRVPGT